MIVPPTPPAPSFRVKRGTKLSAIHQLQPDEIPPLSAIDGPFQLAEYLALKVRADPHDVKGLVEVPAEGRSTDRDVWIYEHLRRIPLDLTPLISQLLTHCSKASCPEMKADEWQYLCVAHGSGVSEECCAIDYILHNLDEATSILCSTVNFPSRMSIPPGSISHFPSLARRLSRIFSHAYFSHREQFLIAESENSLYARFVALCERYSLIGKELLIIPHAAIGANDEADEADDDQEEEEEDNAARDGDEGDDGENEIGRKRDKADGAKDSGAGRRTLSLDRQSGVGVKVLQRPKDKERDVSVDAAPAGSARGDAQQEPSVKEDSPSAELKEPVSASDAPQAAKGGDPDPTGPETAKKISTLGRGTKGRGKQGRGTMLWSSDSAPAAVPDVPPMPETTAPSTLAPVPASAAAGSTLTTEELSRTDSRDSVVYIGPDKQDDDAEQDPKSAVPAAVLGITSTPPRPSADIPTPSALFEAGRAEPPAPVPKDEIELLEEQGKLEPEPSVSPLPPPAGESGIGTQNTSGDSTSPSSTLDPSGTATTKEPVSIDPSSSPPPPLAPSAEDKADPAAAANSQTTPAKTKNASSSSTIPPSLSTAASPPAKQSSSPYKSTAAASPLNPPRTLSRSPEARHRALSGSPEKDKGLQSGSASEDTNQDSGLKLASLPVIPQQQQEGERSGHGAGDDMDAEGKEALVVPGSNKG